MSDLIERQAAISLAGDLQIHSGEYQQYNQAINNYCAELIKLPSVQTSYTDVEIQKMQDLESAEIEKAYRLGYEDGKKDTQQDFDIDQKINKAYDDGYDQGYLQCKADQERTIGHWIERQKKGSCRWQSWCSVCGKHSGIGGIKSNRHKPFCPNCGSPMEGVVYEV